MKHLLPLLSAVCFSAAAASAPPPPVATTTGRPSVPVPPALRGRWAAHFGGIVEPCDPAFPDDFKWSFSAERERFHYWEARGVPTWVRQTAPNRFVIDLAKTGEGSAWKERRTFTLVDGGRSLLVDDPVPDLRLRERRYVRCPMPAAPGPVSPVHP